MGNYDYEKLVEQTTLTAAEAFMKAVNVGYFNPKIFADYVTCDHRSLQQNAARAMVACFEQWAQKEFFDERNEATIALSKKIAKNNLYLPHI